MTVVPEWKIRPAQAADAPAACAIMHEAHAWNLAHGFNFTAATVTPADLLDRFATATYFVAEIDGRIVGTVSIEPDLPGQDPHIVHRDPPEPDPGDWALHNLAVAGSAGGAGLGRALVRHVEAAARQAGGRRMVLDTPENHPWLPGYYEKMGYRRIGHIQWLGKTYRSVLLGRPVVSRSR
ncbi:MAG: GNAT family N-acetyltransferase [Candidatus Sericytochromatia bacterium]|nr:GNAT family N-acetyltransferase [Candidatus Tanganyikabacteria bacterium]